MRKKLSSEKWEVFSECVICNHWSQLNKRWKDGRYYCTIHYQKEQDKVASKRYAEKKQKDLEFLRKIKNASPI